jgi:Flp pilus assembly protein TadG
MIRRRPSLARRSDGSAAIEFAVGLPVLLMMVFGMFQLGIVLQANAGMQHALGEAARLATIFPTPSDAELQARITERKFGPGNGTWGTPTITPGTGTKTITVTYTQPLDWIFFNTTVTLTKSKVVYLSS